MSHQLLRKRDRNNRGLPDYPIIHDYLSAPSILPTNLARSCEYREPAMFI